MRRRLFWIGFACIGTVVLGVILIGDSSHGQASKDASKSAIQAPASSPQTPATSGQPPGTTTPVGLLQPTQTTVLQSGNSAAAEAYAADEAKVAIYQQDVQNDDYQLQAATNNLNSWQFPCQQDQEQVQSDQQNSAYLPSYQIQSDEEKEQQDCTNADRYESDVSEAQATLSNDEQELNYWEHQAALDEP